MKRQKGMWIVALGLLALGVGRAVWAGAAEGEAKFTQVCSTCHGNSGMGDGPASAALNPKPKDLTQTKLSDADLKKVILDGGAAIGLTPIMPSWKAALSEQDVDNIVQYVRALSGK